jgi:glutamyl-tRNA reductase
MFGQKGENLHPPSMHWRKIAIKNGIDFQSRKISDFNLEQAEIHENYPKNNNTFCNHLKDDDTMVDESIEWIEKVFKLALT